MKLPLFVAGVLALLLAPALVIAADPEVPLSEIPTALEKLTKDLQAKLDAAAKVVESEAAAGRLSEPAAQLLRWTLQTSTSANGKLQLRGLITSARLPTDNVAMMTALTELETANNEIQTRRTNLTSGATQSANARLVELVKTATKPQECEDFEKAIETLRQALQAEGISSQFTHSLSSVIAHSQRLKRLLQAEAAGSPAEIVQAVQNFRMVGQSYGNSGPDLSGAVEDRATRATKPLQEAITAAQTALDDALLTRKPAPERNLALEKFVTACDGYAPVQVGGMHVPSKDPRSLFDFYQSMVRTLDDVDQGGSEDLANRISQLQQSLRVLDSARAEKYRAMAAGFEKEAMERTRKEFEGRLTQLQTRLKAVKNAAELDAIASEVSSWANERNRRGRSDGYERWAPVASEIASLAAAWGGSFPGALLDERYHDSNAQVAGISTSLRELRRRVQRELLSRHLRAPELAAPPLVELETEAALDAFVESLVTKAEWRRLLAVLESRAMIQSTRGGYQNDDAISALRSFFAAQNFELAEQWSDAAQAYKEVLRASSPRAPIAPAAEKLKALLKAHPEVASRSTGTPPTEAPVPILRPRR